MTGAAGSGYLDVRDVAWDAVRCATFEVRQVFEYQYPGPIADVRQLLMLVPPDRLGSQRLISYQVHVSPPARPRYDLDRFGNRICQIALPQVIGPLVFTVRLLVETRSGGRIEAQPGEAHLFGAPSPLTEPTAAMRAIAAELAAPAGDATALAGRSNDWVFRRLRYSAGKTDVSTTAADALTLGEGVCQDYAHLMIALCRLNGLPARYVSGHLLGEGAMHAWVQVLVPTETGDVWLPFDPTHGRRAGMAYITVAVGRDFGDVSPTRGSFRAPYSGWLARGEKDAGVLSLDDCRPDAGATAAVAGR